MQAAGEPVRRADAVANRAHILEVAQALFAERGLELEMSEVAARARLGVGTLYRHFANREDLLRALILRTIEDGLTQYRAALGSVSADPRGALQALILAMLRVHQQYGSLFALMRDPRLAKLQLFDPPPEKSIRAQILEIPKALLAEGIKLGVFRADLDHEMAATMILGTLSSAIDFLDAERSLDEMARRLSHFLLAVLERKPAESPFPDGEDA
jgi:AcrR family transcriptional regulator